MAYGARRLKPKVPIKLINSMEKINFVCVSMPVNMHDYLFEHQKAEW